jgi:single-stranded-DNA-specific exonuclease
MRWIDPPAVLSASPFPELHPLVASSLLRRGIDTTALAAAFLDPYAYTPTPATELPGLTAVVDRIELAIRNHESVWIWGDFDVDGQTSTSILYSTLKELGANVLFHIPVRASESHGVNVEHLQGIIASGARLILTCDTGITSHAAVNYARMHGVDFLITDHHDLPASLPKAAAIVDPKFLPEGHPLSTLSGSGVAYKLSEEIFARFRQQERAFQLIDLAALGLVADLAFLIGDARFMVQRGLESLRTTQRLGLQTIMEMADLVPENLSEEHIGFVLGPRLNALGRLGDANPAVELLTTSDPIQARVLATQLESLNAQRQLLCSQVTQAAEAQLRADPSLLEMPVLVLGNPAWPGGIVGIVASRMVERYQKPAILFSSPVGGPAHGSARSIEGLNITAAIAAQKDLLLKFGGHPMAAGLSLDPEKLPEFIRRLAKTVSLMVEKNKTEPHFKIDGWLTFPEITLDLARDLERLAPFGPGNEKLVLVTHRLKLRSTATMGRNQEHLKLNVSDEAGNSRSVLWWNGADEKDGLPIGDFDLAYTLRATNWRGSPQVQMEFVDFHTLDVENIELNSKKLEIVDLRNVKDPLGMLADIQSKPSTQVWAEGIENRLAIGRNRYQLSPAENLVIWTIPSSPTELRLILSKVHPRRIYLFAVLQTEETADTFVAKLAGLLKHAIIHQGGKVTYPILEAATAQAPAVVRLGIHYLVMLGKFSIRSEADNELVISVVGTPRQPITYSQDWDKLRSLLKESFAYRLHFRRSNKDKLFE